MRIEGTYLFNAPIEKVYAALTNPDAIRAALPGCERVIQLGPPDASGKIHGEARVALGHAGAPDTFAWSLTPARIPKQFSVRASGTGAATPLMMAGSVDLAARDGQTVSAYVWDVTGTAPAGNNAATSPVAAAAFLKRVGEALDAHLAATDQSPATLAEALPILRADSARGRITLLPAEPATEPVMTRLRPILNRGLWVAAGLAAGVALLAGLAATLSHLRNRDASVSN